MPIAPPAAFSSSAQPDQQAERDERDRTGPEHADQGEPRAQPQLDVVDEPADERDDDETGQREQRADDDVDVSCAVGTGVIRSCRSQPDARSNDSRIVAPRAAPAPRRPSSRPCSAPAKSWYCAALARLTTEDLREEDGEQRREQDGEEQVLPVAPHPAQLEEQQGGHRSAPIADA